jgi:hypothetical protein
LTIPQRRWDDPSKIKTGGSKRWKIQQRFLADY